MVLKYCKFNNIFFKVNFMRKINLLKGLAILMMLCGFGIIWLGLSLKQ